MGSTQTLFETYPHVGFIKKIDLKIMELFARYCLTNRLPKLTRFLKYNSKTIFDCNYTGYYSIDVIFMHCCGAGYIDIVKYLIALYGIDIHSFNDGALVQACSSGHLNIVKYLIEISDYVIDIHRGNEYIFKCACSGGRMNVVKYLVENAITYSGRPIDMYRIGPWDIISTSRNHIKIMRYIFEVIPTVKGYSDRIFNST